MVYTKPKRQLLKKMFYFKKVPPVHQSSEVFLCPKMVRLTNFVNLFSQKG